MLSVVELSTESVAAIASAIRADRKHACFLLDLDHTLMFRRSSEDVGNRFTENSAFADDSFECKPIDFIFESKRFEIIFRYGVGKLLRLLCKRGKICIVTHACKKYAKRVLKFLSNQSQCGTLNLCCFEKSQLKFPPSCDYNGQLLAAPYFIIDDKPEQWHPLFQESVLPIPSLNADNFKSDIWLFDFFGRNCTQMTHDLSQIELLWNAKIRPHFDQRSPDPFVLQQCKQCNCWEEFYAAGDAVLLTSCSVCESAWQSASDSD
jgi:hypothetical protein